MIGSPCVAQLLGPSLSHGHLGLMLQMDIVELLLYAVFFYKAAMASVCFSFSFQQLSVKEYPVKPNIQQRACARSAVEHHSLPEFAPFCGAHVVGRIQGRQLP